VAICPGLAITLVDYRKSAGEPTVTLAYEFSKGRVSPGDRVTVLDTKGAVLGDVEVAQVLPVGQGQPGLLVKVKAPRGWAVRVAGIRVQDPRGCEPMKTYAPRVGDDTIVCRCERVTAGEIRELIRSGSRDINEIKTVTRAGMGACGSKTCNSIIKALFRQEGVDLEDVTDNVERPLFMEAPLGVFAGVKEGSNGR
jgi:bacterioferritin-associated ferredoxin